jgi:hypothetical protein
LRQRLKLLTALTNIPERSNANKIIDSVRRRYTLIQQNNTLDHRARTNENGRLVGLTVQLA